jgi:hypothetical protein
MTTPDPTLPAIAKLIDLGRRFVLWRAVKDRETGKVRKLPLQAATGKAASSTDPATWATWEACHDARRRHRAAGIGVVFNGDGVGVSTSTAAGTPSPARSPIGPCAGSARSTPTPRSRLAAPA